MTTSQYQSNVQTLLQQLNQASATLEQQLPALLRKRTGSYYTDMTLALDMMQELVAQLLQQDKPIWQYRFLEPCVGTGNFVFAYLVTVQQQLQLTADQAQELLENLYVVDINQQAIHSYQQSLQQLVAQLWQIQLSEEYFTSHVQTTGLLLDVTSSELQYRTLADIFPAQVIQDGFDIVVTNPPYKNLKAERSHYAPDAEHEYQADIVQYTSISKQVKRQFQLATAGNLNLYKLFVEEIICNYTNKHAYISLLIPSSLLSDKTCAKLRTHILTQTQLLAIKVIPEATGYIQATQALCSLLIYKGKTTDKLTMTPNFHEARDTTVSIDIADILHEYTDNAIVPLAPAQYQLLKQLRNFPVVKELDFIVNLRGELDLTINKQCITNQVTAHQLLRGRNIGYYQLIGMDSLDYVTDQFLTLSQKAPYVHQPRLACQQISNMKKQHRVTFAVVPAGYVLANSCNFITVQANAYQIDLYALLGLFNSKLINWLFKLTSSNNHINNYEIDTFPVPIHSPELVEISRLTQQYLQSPDPKLLEQLEALVAQAYGISTAQQQLLTA